MIGVRALESCGSLGRLLWPAALVLLVLGIATPFGEPQGRATRNSQTPSDIYGRGFHTVMPGTRSKSSSLVARCVIP